MIDSTRRFSNRVENYIRYRPRYPREILEPLKTDCGLSVESIIADVGSGTGILSELFLANGNQVFGIEPNREMREAGERLLREHSRFRSIGGSAEETALANKSVDFVVAGQAFHWFHRVRCRQEFKRILRPDGWVVLAWNDRRTDATPFLRDYEQLLLAFATDYEQVNHKRIDAAVLRKFFHGEPSKRTFSNYQHLDFAGLRGRLLSSSYVPEAGQPRHAEMLDSLKQLFDSTQKEGQVTFEYETVIYYGRLH